MKNLKRLGMMILEGISLLGFIAGVSCLLAALWTGDRGTEDSRMFLNSGLTFLVVSVFAFLATYDWDPFAGVDDPEESNTGEDNNELYAELRDKYIERLKQMMADEDHKNTILTLSLERMKKCHDCDKKSTCDLFPLMVNFIWNNNLDEDNPEARIEEEAIKYWDKQARDEV